MQFKLAAFLIIFSKLCQAYEFNLIGEELNCSNEVLHVIRAQNQENTTLFLVTSQGLYVPTTVIMVVCSDPSCKVNLNCSTFSDKDHLKFRNSVTVTNMLDSYGFILLKLCVYADPHNEDKIGPEELRCVSYLGKNLNWALESFNQMPDQDGSIKIVFKANHSLDSHDLFDDDGYVKITMAVYQRDTVPKNAVYQMVRGGLAISFQLEMSGLKLPNPTSRIAPTFLIFANHSLEDNEDFVQLSGLPKNASSGPLGQLNSTFLRLDLKNTKHEATKRAEVRTPSFVHFVPVCLRNQTGYLDLARPQIRTIIQGHSKHFEHSLGYAFYGTYFEQIHSQTTKDHVAMRQQVISLGKPNGAYYYSTNYSSWTMVMGLGHPELEDSNETPHLQSTTAITVTLCILIFVIVVTSAIYIRRRNRTQSQYEPLEDQPSQEGPSHSNDDEFASNSYVEPIQTQKFNFSPRGSGSSEIKPLMHQRLTNLPPPYTEVYLQ